MQGIYDLIRWGNPLNVYGPQLHQADDPMLARGFMSLTYIPRKIYAIVFEAPRYLDNEVFFLWPRGDGTSLIFTTPAFVWILPALARLRDRRWFAVALSGGLVALPGVLFATVGYEQFGYRYSLDLQPFLIVLTAVGAGWAGDRWAPASRLFKGVVVLSIGLCAYYLATIKLFGFAP